MILVTTATIGLIYNDIYIKILKVISIAIGYNLNDKPFTCPTCLPFYTTLIFSLLTHQTLAMSIILAFAASYVGEYLVNRLH